MGLTDRWSTMRKEQTPPKRGRTAVSLGQEEGVRPFEMSSVLLKMKGDGYK